MEKGHLDMRRASRSLHVSKLLSAGLAGKMELPVLVVCTEHPDPASLLSLWDSQQGHRGAVCVASQHLVLNICLSVFTVSSLPGKLAAPHGFHPAASSSSVCVSKRSCPWKSGLGASCQHLAVSKAPQVQQVLNYLGVVPLKPCPPLASPTSL